MGMIFDAAEEMAILRKSIPRTFNPEIKLQCRNSHSLRHNFCLKSVWFKTDNINVKSVMSFIILQSLSLYYKIKLKAKRLYRNVIDIAHFSLRAAISRIYKCMYILSSMKYERDKERLVIIFIDKVMPTIFSYIQLILADKYDRRYLLQICSIIIH